MKKCLFFILFCSLGIFAYSASSTGGGAADIVLSDGCGVEFNTTTGARKIEFNFPDNSKGATEIYCVCACTPQPCKWQTPNSVIVKHSLYDSNHCWANVTCTTVTFTNCNSGGSSGGSGGGGGGSGGGGGGTCTSDCDTEGEEKYVLCGTNNCGTQTKTCVKNYLNCLNWSYSSCESLQYTSSSQAATYTYTDGGGTADVNIAGGGGTGNVVGGL